MLHRYYRHDDGKRLAVSGELQPRSSQPIGPLPPKRLRFAVRSIVIAVLAATSVACGAGASNNNPAPHVAQSPAPKTSGAGINSQSPGSASSGNIPVVTQDPPVLVNSAAYQQAADDGFTYAFPQRVTSQQVAALNNLPVSFLDYIAQVTRLGGANIYDTNVQIVLQGNAVDQTAVITGINVLKQCRQPLSGTLLYSPAAAQDNNIEIGFNLDDRFPIAQDYANARLSGNYFGEHTISLRHGETQSLLVHAITRNYFCQFTYQLLVDTGNREVAEPITDNGRPFTVTAGLKASSYQALYLGGVVSPTENDKYAPVSPKDNSIAIQGYNESVAASS